MCDGLVRDDARAVEQLLLASRSRRAAGRSRCRRSRRDAPCRRTGTRARAGNRTCRTDTGCRCSRSSHSSAAACRSKIASRLRATLRGVGLAVEHAERAAVPLGLLDDEPPGGEREEIRRDRWRLREPHARRVRPSVCRSSLRAVADRLPALGHVERQRPARLQIRLIEAGERLVRARRHEDRVEKIVVAIERRVAGVEFDRHRVLGRAERRLGYDQMPVHLTHLGLRPVDLDLLQETRTIRREVEDERRRRVAQREAHDLTSRDRVTAGRRNRERQVVAQIQDPRRPLAGERFTDAEVGIEFHGSLQCECGRCQHGHPAHRADSM